MSNRALPIAALLATLVGGCAYQPLPLDPAREWSALEGVRLADLAGGAPAPSGAKTAPFNYGDGLSADEAVRVALVLNPDLAAFRHRKGVAEGELLAARTLPNPELEDAKILFGRASGDAEAKVLWDPIEALVERGPRVAAAQARSEEASLEIRGREWALQNDVRSAWLDLAYAEEAEELAKRQAEIAARTAKSVEAQKEAGGASELDLLVAAAEKADADRLARRAGGDRRRALQRLNVLVGLPPRHETPLEKAKNPLAFVPSGIRREVLERRLLSRPDLEGAQAAYLAAEEELRLAYREAWPGIRLGPAFQREDGEAAFGFGFSVDLPIFDRGQGAIAAREAERAQKRGEYAALLHAARDELAAAAVETETLEAEARAFLEEIAPRLDRSLELTEKAFQAGELDLLKVLVVQNRVLQGRRELLEKLRDYHRARIELERAAGPGGRAP